MRRHGLARALIRLAAVVVPAGERRGWLEEWLGELEALGRRQTMGRTSGRAPDPVVFARGALRHALWLRRQGWTLDSLAQDLRYAVRVLFRAPGFTLIAALTLALGIGANASIFSLMNGLLLRPPAGIRAPDRLVQIARSYEDAPRWDNFSYPAMQLIARESPALDGVAGYTSQAFVLGRGAETERLIGEYVNGDYFDVLGVRPGLGRLLQPSDNVSPGGHPVVVLSHGLWLRRFGGNPGIVGATIAIGASPYEVVGVAPAGFAGAESVGLSPALWVPMMQHEGWFGELPFDQWGTSWIDLVGRLADGATFAQADASMSVVASRLREADAVNEDILVLLSPGVGLDPAGRREAAQLSILLAAIAGLVLVLTCANVANLFLARAATRTSEIGVRLAIGAGRGRLARQMLTESLLLALLATLLATPFVVFAGRFLPLLIPYALTVSVAPDGRVYGVMVLVGLVAGVLFGVVPAWAATRRRLTETLREGAATAGQKRTRLRDALVVLQLSLSLSLVAGAALLGKSVFNARSAQPGFTPDGLSVAFVDLASTGRYERDAGRAAFASILSAVRDLPGVASATLANQAPIAGGHSRASARPAGRDDVEIEAEYIVVGSGYFETLEIPLLAGRPLGGFADEPERVVVVNESLARMFWPGEDPIGKELETGASWRVVGLVPDVQMRSLRAAGLPAIYYPAAHAYTSRMGIHVRSERNAGGAAALTAAIEGVDPALPVSPLVRLSDALAESMGETRTVSYLVSAFAILALVLAAVGLYGLVAFGVSQRVREMGIRMALGADPRGLVRLILGRGLGLTAIGVLVGLGFTYGLGKGLEGLLFGVRPSDLPTVAGAALALVLTSGFAAWLPARRAARVDASVSLRNEL